MNRRSVLDNRTTYNTVHYREKGTKKTMVTSYIQSYEKDFETQNKEIAFDQLLRDKAQVKQEKTAQDLHKFQKKWL